MGPRGLTKGNTQLTRQNDFSFTSNQTSVLFNKIKHLGVTVWFRKFLCFVRKRHHTARNSLALGPQGPKHNIFGDHFYSKNARKLRFHVFLLFDARNYMISSFYLKWTEFTRNCEFFSNYGSPGTRTKLEQIYNFF